MKQSVLPDMTCFVTDVLITEPDGQQGPLVIDHPLAQESSEMTSSDGEGHNEQEMDNRIPRDSQNNALSNQSKSEKNLRSSQHGHCLTLSDHDRLRIFVHEFIVRGLIPWAERTLRTLSEQVRGILVSD